nr:hypothetical protein [Tanacetum cinerariifolium]
ALTSADVGATSLELSNRILPRGDGWRVIIVSEVLCRWRLDEWDDDTSSEVLLQQYKVQMVQKKG